MSSIDDDPMIGQVTRTAQIIVGALAMGLVFFLAVVLFLGMQAGNRPPGAGAGVWVPPAPTPAQPFVTYLAIAMAAVEVGASIVAPRLMADGQRRRIAKGTWTSPGQNKAGLSSTSGTLGDAEKLAAVFQTQMIVGVACLEGAGFFALIAYFLEHQPLALVLSLALIAAVASRFPTRDRVNRWIEGQLDRLAQDRQSGL